MDKLHVIGLNGQRRRVLTAGASLAALAWSVAARAQAKPPVLIGWLASRSRESSYADLVALKEGLAVLGWNIPRIVIEERWASGHYERLPTLAQEIVAKKPALIVTQGGQAAAAAAKAAPGMPIVMASISDPVAAGFAASLARPGGMMTGTTNVSTDIIGKLVELMHEVAPKVRRIGYLVNSTNINYAAYLKAAQRSASQQSVELRVADVLRPDEIEAAVSKLAAEGVQALIVMPSSMFVAERQRIAKLALARRWPVISGQKDFGDTGALLTYGFDILESIRRAAYYVDRILKGAKPADLPIEQPTRFDVVVNLKTAKALGITMPQSVMVRATKVIE